MLVVVDQTWRITFIHTSLGRQFYLQQSVEGHGNVTLEYVTMFVYFSPSNTQLLLSHWNKENTAPPHNRAAQSLYIKM